MDGCPLHKLELVEFPVRIGRGSQRTAWACPVPVCGYMTLTRPERLVDPQRRLGIMKRERKSVVLQEAESGVSRRIEDRFRTLGYEVLVTSEHRKKVKCAVFSKGVQTAGCGIVFYPHEGTGVDLGIPDIFVRDPRRYPPYCWGGIEVKGPKTPISDAQRAFGARLGYIIARSDEEAWEGIEWFESLMEPAFAQWTLGCCEILRARQRHLEVDPVWQRDRLAWLLFERESVERIARQSLATINAQIRELEGQR